MLLNEHGEILNSKSKSKSKLYVFGVKIIPFQLQEFQKEKKEIGGQKKILLKMCVKPEDANSDVEGNVSRNVLRPFHLRLRDSAAGLHLKFQNPLVEKGIPRPFPKIVFIRISPYHQYW